MTENDVERLLQQWEETYKKGLLTFWLLLLLSQRKAYPYEMKSAITELSQGTITAEDNSIYRALRRMNQSGIVDSEMRPSKTGPSRRYFFITEIGLELLTKFIRRNIHVFQHPEVANQIQRFDEVDA
ncbi:MAG TPA: PadR family transcriptional regulator [Anaerolineae bacterium]|nr:PadR family transcriptional regulator [Anaerolineae bacterium]